MLSSLFDQRLPRTNQQLYQAGNLMIFSSFFPIETCTFSGTSLRFLGWITETARRSCSKLASLFVIAIVAIVVGDCSCAGTQPNVIVVISDDQGYGDLSCHGNPILRTPSLDRLHSESIRLTNFHVAPMCTPTRGQLMTGIDCLKNGAMNVSSGRTLLRRNLTTMPEYLKSTGYATGLFGKWHLGDSYPYRPQDRGFDECVWFPSSHIGSVPDRWLNDYFDDTYLHRDQREQYSGYTTDVFFEQAMQWIANARADKPFFAYIATAAPHQPHYVPEQYRNAN
jgi:arylsulfatase A-like enzyme